MVPSAPMDVSPERMEVDRAIAANSGRIRHYHAGRPQLAPVVPGTGIPHERCTAALREPGNVRAVSVELRQVVARQGDRPHLERALDFVAAACGG